MCANGPCDGRVFFPLASLAIGRYYHTATTLPNGKVLVAGGNRPTGSNFVTISGVYHDPATSHWSSAVRSCHLSRTTRRRCCRAAVL